MSPPPPLDGELDITGLGRRGGGARLCRLTGSSKYLDISRGKGYSADVSGLLIGH